MAQENKNENVQEQQDKTPKWMQNAILLFAIGSCSTAIAAAFGLFGDAFGQRIKNNSFTKNYIKRLDANFADMVRRDQYYRNRRRNG